MNRRNELGIADCDKCQKTMTTLQRQTLGCGYEPPSSRVRLALWQPPSGYSGPKPTICAGYTVRLPEIRETSIARAHWTTGNIGAVFGGEPPTEDLLNAIIILEGAQNDVDRWRMTPAKDGGGGS